ncbi:hypothetical protein ABVK25_002527 [Lepraria finkii]|uniref:Nuclear pore complex NUP2/50/61 domain-containing protein n=1 Tax=Lepraria finkii TaxID=1340010 RepID=A0ABR4BI33_9LECA
MIIRSISTHNDQWHARTYLNKCNPPLPAHSITLVRAPRYDFVASSNCPTNVNTHMLCSIILHSSSSPLPPPQSSSSSPTPPTPTAPSIPSLTTALHRRSPGSFPSITTPRHRRIRLNDLSNFSTPNASPFKPDATPFHIHTVRIPDGNAMDTSSSLSSAPPSDNKDAMSDSGLNGLSNFSNPNDNAVAGNKASADVMAGRKIAKPRGRWCGASAGSVTMMQFPGGAQLRTWS